MNVNLYSKLYLTLKSGKGAVLVRIVRRKGSAPRGVGSACMVDGDGTLFGSIGGGLLEYRAVEEAKVLLDKKITSLSTFTMTAKEISDEGMICGGSVELFFEPILPDDRIAVGFFKRIDELSRSGGRGTLITQVRDANDAMEPYRRMLVKQDGSVIGTIPSMEFREHVTRAHLIQQKGTDNQFFLEPVVQKPALLLFGGGHISTFVSPIAKTLGFHVTVFDDRSDFANRERFPEADEICAMSYQAAFENISITGSSFIIIVTRGHGGDRDILELVLKSGTSSAYIGMIGSIRKRDTIYKSLIENGIPQKVLTEIYSPIGLDIGAHTPEEIAVSIMAEIIQLKATGS
jgi:xanthine dehydrogenase accessory factor